MLLASLAASIIVRAPICVLAYFAIGLWLSRFVASRFAAGPIEWNWYLASLADVSRAKLSMLIRWPIAFPVLIWELSVFKFL